MTDTTLKQNVDAILARIAAAAERAGRAPSEVQLIAVTKTVTPDRLQQAAASGIEICGENRVQEAQTKIGEVEGVRWHLIGHLQRNKARRAVEMFELIHTLDSLRLANTLDRLGVERGRPVDALIEVNVGGEASKAGVDPESLKELAKNLAGREGLRIHGLMTLPPWRENPEDVRPDFQRLRQLAADLRAADLHGVSMDHLSMGMSHDFEVAVEEGATFVRVGTALFGARP